MKSVVALILLVTLSLAGCSSGDGSVVDRVASQQSSSPTQGPSVATVSASNTQGTTPDDSPTPPVAPSDPPRLVVSDRLTYIGFDDEGDTFLATSASDGTDESFVLEGGMFLANPAWSPSKTEIAYEDSGLYVVKADGTNQRYFMSGYLPSWAPDGKRLAYVDEGDLRILDLTTSTSTTIVTGNVGSSDGMSWSPDGSAIAFTRFTGDRASRTLTKDIWRADVRTGQLTAVTNFAQLLWSGEPDWSPDGSRIVFTVREPCFEDSVTCSQLSRDGSRQFWVYMIRPDSSVAQRLSADVALEGGPVWSPDGSRILFERYRDGAGVFTMDADGGNRVQVSVDGTWIDW